MKTSDRADRIITGINSNRPRMTYEFFFALEGTSIENERSKILELIEPTPKDEKDEKPRATGKERLEKIKEILSPEPDLLDLVINEIKKKLLSEDLGI